MYEINKETRTTTAKEFKVSPEVNNGLAIGILDNVEVSTFTVKDDAKWIDYRGKEAVRLSLIFKEVPKEAGVEAGIYIHSYNFIDHSNTDRNKFIAGMFQTIKHIIGVYKGGVENITDAEYAYLKLDLEDAKNYTAEEIIAAYTKFFNGVKTVIDGCTTKDIKVWMKLLLYIKGSNVNGGKLGFTSYPGEGLIELYKQDVEPSLTIRIARQESIIPRSDSAPTSPIGDGEIKRPSFLG